MFELLLLILLLPYSYDWVMGFFYDSAYVTGAEMGFDMDLALEAYYQWDAYFCAFILLLYLPWYLYIKRRDKDASAQIPRKKIRGKELLKLSVIAMGMSGVSELWLRFVDGIMYQNNLLGMGDSMDSFVETWSGGPEEAYIWTFLSIVLFGPLAEELLFRGIQYHYAERIRRGWFPILFTAISFGIWHSEPVQVVYTSLMGIAIAIVYQNMRNFYAPLFIHIINNFTAALPPAWDTDSVYGALTDLSLLLILPALLLLIKMAKENVRVNRQLRWAGVSEPGVAALRSSMLFERELVEKWQREQAMMQDTVSEPDLQMAGAEIERLDTASEEQSLSETLQDVAAKETPSVRENEAPTEKKNLPTQE